MRPVLALIPVIAVLAGAALWGSIGPPRASAIAAEDAECAGGTLPPGAYATVTVTGNCALDAGHVIAGDLLLLGGTPTVEGTRVGGDLVVDLDWANVYSVEVAGDVVLRRGFSFGLIDSAVGGDVVGAENVFSSIRIEGTEIAGSIRLTDAAGDGVGIVGNDVQGDVVLAGVNGYRVEGNRIAGSLRLLGNETAEPFEITANAVGGDLELLEHDVVYHFPPPVEGFETVVIGGNVVQGSLRIVDSSGPISVTGNVVGEQLICDGNEDVTAANNIAAETVGTCGPGGEGAEAEPRRPLWFGR